MMDVTEWTYKEFDGLPPNGESGYFLGYDADLQPYILKWNTRTGGFWMAATLDDATAGDWGGAEPIAHALGPDHRVQIKKWAALPVRWSVLENDGAK
jgi:hypothetical protein